MKKNITPRLMFAGILMVALSAAAPGWAQTLPTPPDLGVCNEFGCDIPPESTCSPGGFRITLAAYNPADSSNTYTATYKYKICNPDGGACNGTARPGQYCLDNSFCRSNGAETDPTATCSRDCAVDNFYDLGHFDVTFPELGNSCLGAGTQVTGTCECGPPEVCDVNPTVLLGDAECFSGAPVENGEKVVARCYGLLGFNPGRCMIMTLYIAGYNPDLILGPAVVVDKTDQSCNASCLPGPSCAPCPAPLPNREACLTRTHGFWGTHPDIAAKFEPVTVCGFEVKGQEPGTCSTSEALCSNANDYKQNPAYLSLVTQLTAAKLNLHASAKLLGGSCSNWSFGNYTIEELISYCEDNFCDLTKVSKQDIGRSGCIEALTAFNESQEKRFEVLPDPFDKPGPANPRQCQEARGNGEYIRLGGNLGCVAVP